MPRFCTSGDWHNQKLGCRRHSTRPMGSETKLNVESNYWVTTVGDALFGWFSKKTVLSQKTIHCGLIVPDFTMELPNASWQKAWQGVEGNHNVLPNTDSKHHDIYIHPTKLEVATGTWSAFGAEATSENDLSWNCTWTHLFIEIARTSHVLSSPNCFFSLLCLCDVSRRSKTESSEGLCWHGWARWWPAAFVHAWFKINPCLALGMPNHYVSTLQLKGQDLLPVGPTWGAAGTRPHPKQNCSHAKSKKGTLQSASNSCQARMMGCACTAPPTTLQNVHHIRVILLFWDSAVGLWNVKNSDAKWVCPWIICWAPTSRKFANAYTICLPRWM